MLAWSGLVIVVLGVGRGIQVAAWEVAAGGISAPRPGTGFHGRWSLPAARPAEPGDEAGRSRSSAGNGYLMPQPAVQVEVIAVGLAGGGISDVGVQGMPVVGGLRRAV